MALNSRLEALSSKQVLSALRTVLVPDSLYISQGQRLACRCYGAALPDVKATLLYQDDPILRWGL